MKSLLVLFSLLLFSSSNAQTIRIGTQLYNPPFEVEAGKKGVFLGFDVDLMLEICKRLQAQCQFIPLTFAQIFAQLLTETIDLGLGAISITEARAATYLFTLPYLASRGQFITQTGSKVNSLDDLPGKTVGVVQGGVFKTIILEQYNNTVKVTEYPTLSETFQALSNGQVDLIITDEESAKYWATTNNIFKLVGKSTPVGIGYGIMANKKNGALINDINKILINMETDGTYLKIYNHYFSPMG